MTQYILNEIQNLENIGVFFGLISVGLTVKENIWCWPFGIVNVLIFAWIFFQSAIYGQLLLQFFFITLILYGWYNWIYGNNNKEELKITNISRSEILYLLPISFFLITILNSSIGYFTSTEKFTLLDSIITVLSFIAQYLLAKKVLENWNLWILIDILSIYLFFQSGLFKIAFFYFILLILATTGYFTWKKKLEI